MLFSLQTRKSVSCKELSKKAIYFSIQKTTMKEKSPQKQQ